MSELLTEKIQEGSIEERLLNLTVERYFDAKAKVEHGMDANVEVLGAAEDKAEFQRQFLIMDLMHALLVDAGVAQIDVGED